MEKIYVSWTEQWGVTRYIDHYLTSRKYAVDDQSRAALRMLIAQYPSKAPLKKSDLDFYLDANVKNILKLEKAVKEKKKTLSPIRKISSHAKGYYYA